MDGSLPGSSDHGDSPGKNTGLGCHAFLQGIFPTQGSKPGLPRGRWILYRLSHQGSPRILKWVAYPFSSRSSWARGWMVLWRPTRHFRINTPKRCPFHYRGLEWESSKSRDTWNNRQIWPWSTKWSSAKGNRVLYRERTVHSKHPLPQHKRWVYALTSLDDQYWNQIDYILAQQTGSK